MNRGVDGLSDAELLAIVLGTGSKGLPVVCYCEQLINHFGSLRRVLAASPQQLIRIHGVGRAKASQIVAISELSRRSLAEALKLGSALDHPHHVKQYCQTVLGHRTVEHCIALFLNTQLKLITCVELSRGTLSEAAVYPREIVRKALEHHAAAVILAHNHPSGSNVPSAADLSLTRRVADALKLVDIHLVDHLIVAGQDSLSLAETGQL